MPTLTKTQAEKLFVSVCYRCICCGKNKPLQIDHVIPVSRGGRNILSNCQPLCASCNSRKGNKAVDYRVKSNPHYKIFD